MVTSPAEAPERAARPPTRLPQVAKRLLGGFLLVMVVSNAAIVVLSLVIRTLAPPAAVPIPITGVEKLSLVDDRVWRGAAPSLDGYQSLRDAGVTTIVDLRAEADAADRDTQIEALGLRVVHLPIRDGQTPSESQVASFIAEVDAGDGVVFVHCGAGVGRTGSMVAAYRVTAGLGSGVEAAARNLSVGPPSLEQLAFTASLQSGGQVDRPPLAVVMASRVLDAPRRLMSLLDWG